MKQNKAITTIKTLIYQSLYELYDECISNFLAVENDINYRELMSIHNDFFALKVAISDVLINKNISTLIYLIDWEKQKHPIVCFGKKVWSSLLKYFKLLKDTLITK